MVQLVSFYRLSVVTKWLTEMVWPQFAKEVFQGGTRSLHNIEVI